MTPKQRSRRLMRSHHRFIHGSHAQALRLTDRQVRRRRGSWLDERTMSEIKKVLVSLAIFVALFAMFAFAPPRDPTKVVPGMPCSVLSENDISAVLGGYAGGAL